jgi:hypothetical protein
MGIFLTSQDVYKRDGYLAKALAAEKKVLGSRPFDPNHGSAVKLVLSMICHCGTVSVNTAP